MAGRWSHGRWGSVAVCVLAFTLAGCGSTGSKGATSNHNERVTTTTAVPQTTVPSVGPTESETSYKASATAITIAELVNGRLNAPNLPIGTLVTFTGTIQRLLQGGSGQTSGLILKDTTSSVTVCIPLSTRAVTADAATAGFMSAMDTVTIWGAWEGTASAAGRPVCPTSSTVVSEMYLTDDTTGHSDDGT
jgi:hypothetical protein